ncbi:MAG: alpha-amylase [Bacteroidota bacterium]
MTSICFSFQVHQPTLLSDYDFFQIGHTHAYFDHSDNQNREGFIIDERCNSYNKKFIDIIKQSQGHFKASFSISGTALDQLTDYHHNLQHSFKQMVETGCVEMLCQPYYHSLSYLYSTKEFQRQVILHREAIQEKFQVSPKIFRNTETVYGNDIARTVEEMGFLGILSDGTDSLLMGRSANHIYLPLGTRRIRALLKNQSLSADLAVNFFNSTWVNYPLTPVKFVEWIKKQAKNGDSTINLFLDYSIFSQPSFLPFLEKLVLEVLKNKELDFKTPSEVLDTYPVKGTYDVPYSASWAEVGKDLPGWMENYLQREAIERIYRLEDAIKAQGDEELLLSWSNLQTADHFYRMSNQEPKRYDAYINYMNILTDLEQQVKNSASD